MYRELSKLHSEFIYKRYSVKQNSHHVVFKYEFTVSPNITFKPQVVIPKSTKGSIDSAALNNLAFNLGLMEIPNYWKATCSPKIIVQAGYLKREQIAFLRKLIVNGLGEFFYQNKIDPKKPNFISIESDPNAPRHGLYTQKDLSKKKVMIPMGGGKDSVVTLEILRNSNFKLGVFQIRTKTNFKTPPLRIKTSDAEKKLIVERTIDKKLLELNRRGYLNGHTPFSAYIAFASVITAMLNGYKYIAVSNERSANDGNFKYKGMVINHQWSKSYEFEKLFREYCRKFISRDVDYFSFLRPLNELQIAGLFSRYPQHFGTFISCNVGSKGDKPKWCNDCPKCLFTYIMLYPFLSRQTLKQIFGQDLLEKKSLLPQAKALLGFSSHKPLECVGTEDETRVAIARGLKKDKKPPFIVMSLKTLLNNYTNKSFSISKRHFLPKPFEVLLRDAI